MKANQGTLCNEVKSEALKTYTSRKPYQVITLMHLFVLHHVYSKIMRKWGHVRCMHEWSHPVRCVVHTYLLLCTYLVPSFVKILMEFQLIKEL